MFAKRNVFQVVLLVMMVASLLALPMVAGAQAANGITAPKDGATVSGTVDITGTANDPQFMKWQLDLLPKGNQNAPIFLAVGETPGAVKYALNTLPLPNGEHAVRLRVVRTNGNYNEYTNKFTIANGAAPAAAAATTPKPATPVTTTVKAATAVTTTTAVKATTPVTPTVKATTPVTTTAKATAPVTTTAKPAAAPVAAGNGITAPKDGATVSGTVDITGNANDPQFMKWQLDLLPSGNQNAPIFLAVGETPGAVKYALNTLPLPNGEHALRLRVVRNNSNYDEFITKFTIANGAAPAAAKP